VGILRRESRCGRGSRGAVWRSRRSGTPAEAGRSAAADHDADEADHDADAAGYVRRRQGDVHRPKRRRAEGHDGRNAGGNAGRAAADVSGRAARPVPEDVRRRGEGKQRRGEGRRRAGARAGGEGRRRARRPVRQSQQAALPRLHGIAARAAAGDGSERLQRRHERIGAAGAGYGLRRAAERERGRAYRCHYAAAAAGRGRRVSGERRAGSGERAGAAESLREHDESHSSAAAGRRDEGTEHGAVRRLLRLSRARLHAERDRPDAEGVDRGEPGACADAGVCQDAGAGVQLLQRRRREKQHAER